MASTIIDASLPKLLIIDDDDFHIQLIAHYLHDFEFDIFSASNGKEGIQIATQVQPHVILLDIYMPGMSGFETCQHLKENANTQTIPIIFCSASNKPEDIAAVFTHQGEDYILKPAREEEVIARITANLTRQERHASLEQRLTTLELRHNIKLTKQDKTTKQTQVNVDALYKVRDLLLKDLQQTFSLDELSQKIGSNRNKLNEQFRLVFGDTVFNWLREQRLQKARQLLSNETTFSVQIISEMSGYNSQAQFSRAFKQRFGISPSEFRQSD